MSCILNVIKNNCEQSVQHPRWGEAERGERGEESHNCQLYCSALEIFKVWLVSVYNEVAIATDNAVNRFPLPHV